MKLIDKSVNQIQPYWKHDTTFRMRSKNIHLIHNKNFQTTQLAVAKIIKIIRHNNNNNILQHKQEH